MCQIKKLQVLRLPNEVSVQSVMGRIRATTRFGDEWNFVRKDSETTGNCPIRLVYKTN